MCSDTIDSLEEGFVRIKASSKSAVEAAARSLELWDADVDAFERRSYCEICIERGGGKIVNIATDAARVGQEREANYSAAKGAVIAFTKSLAKEVGRHNVNVNVVSPGATNSPMRIGLQQQLRQKLGDEAWKAREAKVLRLYPLRRIGEMEDITNTVLFMTSDAARHITGQVLSVNGGFAMA